MRCIISLSLKAPVHKHRALYKVISALFFLARLVKQAAAELSLPPALAGRRFPRRKRGRALFFSISHLCALRPAKAAESCSCSWFSRGSPVHFAGLGWRPGCEGARGGAIDGHGEGVGGGQVRGGAHGVDVQLAARRVRGLLLLRRLLPRRHQSHGGRPGERRRHTRALPGARLVDHLLGHQDGPHQRGPEAGGAHLAAGAVRPLAGPGHLRERLGGPRLRLLHAVDLQLRGVPAGERGQEVRAWHCGWDVGDDQGQLHGGEGLRRHVLPLLPRLPQGVPRVLPGPRTPLHKAVGCAVMYPRRHPGAGGRHTAVHGDRAHQEPLHALQGLAEAAARPHQPGRPLPGDCLRAHRRPRHPFLAPGGGWERPARRCLQHFRRSLRRGHRLPGEVLPEGRFLRGHHGRRVRRVHQRLALPSRRHCSSKAFISEEKIVRFSGVLGPTKCFCQGR